VKIVHTHPLKSYNKVGLATFEHMEDVRGGKKDCPPMPPSPSMDILGAIQTARYFGEDSKKITQEVIDLSGVWEFRVSNLNNSFVKNVGDFLEQAGNAENLLNKEQIALFKKFTEENTELIEKTDPRSLLLVFKFHPDSNIQKLGKDLEEATLKRAEAVYNEFMFIQEMEILGRNIAKSPYSKNKDRWEKTSFSR